jgi:hypothetical protein
MRWREKKSRVEKKRNEETGREETEGEEKEKKWLTLCPDVFSSTSFAINSTRLPLLSPLHSLYLPLPLLLGLVLLLRVTEEWFIFSLSSLSKFLGQSRSNHQNKCWERRSYSLNLSRNGIDLFSIFFFCFFSSSLFLFLLILSVSSFPGSHPTRFISCFSSVFFSSFRWSDPYLRAEMLRFWLHEEKAHPTVAARAHIDGREESDRKKRQNRREAERVRDRDIREEGETRAEVRGRNEWMKRQGKALTSLSLSLSLSL